MGHDITAVRPGVDYDTLNARYELVAYNRRSAGNPLNQVLYLALGVLDEAYAGCSGNGITLSITLEQLLGAREVLDNKRFTGMTRERNMGDDLVSMFQSMGWNVVDCSEPNDDDVSQEREFIDNCIAFLVNEGRDSIDITFG